MEVNFILWWEDSLNGWNATEVMEEMAFTSKEFPENEWTKGWAILAFWSKLPYEVRHAH